MDGRFPKWSRRYKILSEYYCKNIDAYNELIEENLKYMAENPPVENEDGELVQPVLERNGLPVPKEKMPRIVIAIDELADLMMQLRVRWKSTLPDLLKKQEPQVCICLLQRNDLR